MNPRHLDVKSSVCNDPLLKYSCILIYQSLPLILILDEALEQVFREGDTKAITTYSSVE